MERFPGAFNNLIRSAKPGLRVAKVIRTLVLLACLLSACPGRAAETSLTEHQVKALFLFNFTKYVDWPAGTFLTASNPITIGVLGQDDIKSELTRAVAGKNVNGRAIVIRPITKESEIAGCQILFIAKSENSRLAEILRKIADQPILTVGEDDTFLPQGGIINLALKAGKVRPEINLQSAQTAKVQISSKLLSVADVVKVKSN